MPSVNGMQFYWGNYKHPPGEVYPADVQAKPLFNERGQRWANEYRLHVRGDLLPIAPATALNPAAITLRIQQLDAAYSFDYADCGFLMDGALTPHRLVNGDRYNLSGNQVIYRSWDNVYPTEYQNLRSFSVIIRALFLDSYSEVLSFQESVQKRGTGGPIWELRNTASGPKRVNILPTSKVTHVQRGTLVGATAHLQPPDPLWPLEEHEDFRVIVQHSPRFYGNPRLRPGTQYRTDYAYFFERLGPDPLGPNDWIAEP